MLPLQQAREVRDSVIEYIKATFRFKEKDVSDAFYRFIEDKQEGLFKGPYISLKTPFISATAEESADIPLDIAPNFAPYKHQLQAFKQLTMKDGHQPEPTLLTTGTGSGKTTFLNALSNYIPSDERVITIEDSAELQIRNVPNLVRLETRNAKSLSCTP